MFSLNHLILIGLVVLGVAYWWRSMGAREVALKAARRHCEQHALQLLDDSVVLRGIWLERDRNARLSVRRSYRFEFSATGAERYQGRIVTLGDRVQSVQLSPHRFHPDQNETLH
jgi:hypothetical protein